jgi:hypothetical protein
VRAKVEHPFCVVKRLWGFTKVRYRGLAKNANRPPASQRRTQKPRAREIRKARQSLR